MRLKHYREFCELSGKVLDIGPPSFVSKSLGITNHTLDSDFNQAVLPNTIHCDAITVFEVLEHVMNPALFLKNIKAWSCGARIYLSTPLCPPLSRYVWEGHFTEYRLEALLTLFDYVGLRVIRYEVFRSLPISHAFTGIRPAFGWFMYKTILFELR